MPALTITIPSITAGAVQVAEQQSGVVAGVVVLGSTMLHGIALLNGLFVDPPFWRQGVGRMLFAAAVARAPALKAGAILIYAEPFAEGFYRRVGAIKIGEGPFLLSPEVLLPHFLYILPKQA
jgi:GNAT superfamily N-acetyltransferase